MLSGLANEARAKRPADDRGYDNLTGLSDANAFAAALAAARTQPATLMLLDLDGFKRTNLRFGYAAGDRVLRVLAGRLARFLPTQALASRMEGDRFAILYQDRMEPADASALAHRLLTLVAIPIRQRGAEIGVAASAGIASHPGDQGSFDLLPRAQLALEEAKRAGGRCLRVFDPAPAWRPAPADELTQALRKGQWELHYQPQYHLPDRRLAGVEALLRWRHPERGLLAPAAFLSDLERHPTMHDVGQWIVERACADLARWRGDGLAVPQVAVNLFPDQLERRTLRSDVATALGRNGLRAGDLELEVTERVVLDPAGALLNDLRALRADGVQIALDDFGTGFASFTTLRQLPITSLKIDRSFVADLRPGSTDMAVVRAILALGRDLHLRVVVEGVETDAQMRRLLRMGCRIFQGHHFGPPERPEALATDLAR